MRKNITKHIIYSATIFTSKDHTSFDINVFPILVLSIDNDYYVIHNYLHVSMYYARDETPVYLFYFDMWSDASACNHDTLAREQARVCAHFKDLGINVPLFGILFPNFKFIYSFKIWVAVVVIYGGIAK